MRKLGVVVPSLAEGGGVPAVARFICDTAVRSGRYEPVLVSLCMSSREPTSRLIRSPSTWLRGPAMTHGTWRGHSFVHVGANWAELEFQRYRPRRLLAKVLEDVDLIQVVCGSAAWANAVVGLGKPVALEVASRIVVERRQRDRQRGLMGHVRRAMTRISNRLDDRALQSVDAIQLMNPWMLEYSRRLNVGRNVDLRYAPPGIDAYQFVPRSCRTWSQAPYILCVGRLSDPRKNIGLLLEAYALLPQGVQREVRLVLAGASAPPREFWQRAEELSMTSAISWHHLPSQEALVRLYQDAALFALPSDEEGLGVVLLEAMACGIPVVSTRSGGPDGIITEGIDGFLTPRDDAAAMATRIRQLLSDLECNERMGRAARDKVLDRYDEHVAGGVFVDMWDRMMCSGPLQTVQGAAGASMNMCTSTTAFPTKE